MVVIIMNSWHGLSHRETCVIADLDCQNTWEEGPSIEELHPLECCVAMSVGPFLDFEQL